MSDDHEDEAGSGARCRGVAAGTWLAMGAGIMKHTLLALSILSTFAGCAEPEPAATGATEQAVVTPTLWQSGNFNDSVGTAATYVYVSTQHTTLDGCGPSSIARVTKSSSFSLTALWTAPNCTYEIEDIAINS